MNTIISADKVYALAFAAQEPYTSAIITDMDILEAQTRYLLPILGQELLEDLCDGLHPSLKNDYVAPALAAYVRYLIEPLLDLRCTACRGEGVSTAANERVAMSREALHHKAAALRRRLSDYLNANCDSFKAYVPENNPLNHCLIYGNIVQTI